MICLQCHSCISETTWFLIQETKYEEWCILQRSYTRKKCNCFRYGARWVMLRGMLRENCSVRPSSHIGPKASEISKCKPVTVTSDSNTSQISRVILMSWWLVEWCWRKPYCCDLKNCKLLSTGSLSILLSACRSLTGRWFSGNDESLLRLWNVVILAFLGAMRR